MTLETLFAVFNFSIIPLWLLLIVAPKWIWTQRIVHGIGLPIAIACWMFALQVTGPSAPSGASALSLHGVTLLVGGEQGTLLVWTLLLSWDLLAGAWLARDARRFKIHHGWVVVCLIATYLFGIEGLFLYLVIRFFSRRIVTMDETQSAAISTSGAAS